MGLKEFSQSMSREAVRIHHDTLSTIVHGLKKSFQVISNV